MLQLRQHMPRKQIAFGSVRVARQDERLGALGLIRLEFGQKLVGITNLIAITC